MDTDVLQREVAYKAQAPAGIASGNDAIALEGGQGVSELEVARGSTTAALALQLSARGGPASLRSSPARPTTSTKKLVAGNAT